MDTEEYMAWVKGVLAVAATVAILWLAVWAGLRYESTACPPDLPTPATSTPGPSAYTPAVPLDSRTSVLLNDTDANACSSVAHNLLVSWCLRGHNEYSAPFARIMEGCGRSRCGPPVF